MQVGLMEFCCPISPHYSVCIAPEELIYQYQELASCSSGTHVSESHQHMQFNSIHTITYQPQYYIKPPNISLSPGLQIKMSLPISQHVQHVLITSLQANALKNWQPAA
jgi:hypothetical protein